MREHFLDAVFWLLAGMFLLLVLLSQDAPAAERVELPPPPVPLEQLDGPEQETQVAAARPQGREVGDAEQLWPRPEAESIAADGPIAPEPVGLPPGVQPNPNLNAATSAANVPAAPSAQALNANDPLLSALKQEAPRRSALESLLYDQLRAALPTGSQGYLFEKASLPAQIKLPPGPYSVRYDFRMPQRGIGPVPFTGNVLNPNGQTFSRFTGSAWIDREATGLQVTRVIARGETVQPSDVQPLGTRLTQLPRGALDNPTLVAGAVAKSELRPGVWLTDQHLQVAQVVKRGQAVTIRLERGALEITAPGVSKQDGAIGQVIKIENVQSKREIFARVLSADEVRVLF